MMRRAAFGLGLALAMQPARAHACDTALVLLLDVSGSVSAEHFDLQRDGTADALESPAVLHAARGGLAVSILMWGTDQHHILPWRILHGPADARAAAQALRDAARPESGQTDMAAAIRAGLAEFRHAPCGATQRVIDISGDGPHSGLSFTLDGAVAEAAAAGVRINALPIETQREPDIADWFRSHVDGPTGGFVIAADWPGFARAIRAKLIAEVASR